MHSKACKAIRVNIWPDELFELFINALNISKHPITNLAKNQQNKINELLIYLETDMAKKLNNFTQKRITALHFVSQTW